MTDFGAAIGTADVADVDVNLKTSESAVEVPRLPPSLKTISFAAAVVASRVIAIGVVKKFFASFRRIIET